MQQRLLIVRGDLNSSSGYSQAIQLYTSRLATHFDVVAGVDLHPNPARTLERWPYPILQDREIATALREADGAHLVLSVTTPNLFRRFAGARNVGLFFWETTLMRQPRWLDGFRMMDEVWLPAQFMLEAVRNEEASVPLLHVPCPLRELRDAHALPLQTTPFELLLHEIGPEREVRPLSSLSEVRARYRHVALSTNTLLARKGFPVLAHEWAEFVRDRADSALVIKISSIDVTESSSTLLDRVRTLFRGVADRLDVEQLHVFVTTANLSAFDMRRLLDACDLYVTASFGEGLGLGVFEALFAGRPSVCPRHTSFAELLPDDYAYAVPCDIQNVSLLDPMRLIPPSARWGIPDEGALSAALDRCVGDLVSGAAGSHVVNAANACIRLSDTDFTSLLSEHVANTPTWLES